MYYPYETDREAVDRLIREVRELRDELFYLRQRLEALEAKRNEKEEVPCE